MNHPAPEVHEALAEVPEPTEDGWYAYDDSALTLIFRLTRGQWYAVADNGSMAPCVWGYIEQVLSTCNLVPLVPASVLADHFAKAVTEARARELREAADDLDPVGAEGDGIECPTSAVTAASHDSAPELALARVIEVVEMYESCGPKQQSTRDVLAAVRTAARAPEAPSEAGR